MSRGRLRSGEWLAALASVGLLVALLAGHWYLDPARSGFHALLVLRWFVLVGAALGLAAWLTQLVVRGPALPSTLDLFTMLLGGLTTILIAIRLATTGASLGWAAWVGVLSAAGLALGGFRALRAEQGWDADPDQPERPVELVVLDTEPERR